MIDCTADRSPMLRKRGKMKNKVSAYYSHKTTVNGKVGGVKMTVCDERLINAESCGNKRRQSGMITKSEVVETAHSSGDKVHHTTNSRPHKDLYKQKNKKLLTAKLSPFAVHEASSTVMGDKKSVTFDGKCRADVGRDVVCSLKPSPEYAAIMRDCKRGFIENTCVLHNVETDLVLQDVSILENGLASEDPSIGETRESYKTSEQVKFTERSPSEVSEIHMPEANCHHNLRPVEILGDADGIANDRFQDEHLSTTSRDLQTASSNIYPRIEIIITPPSAPNSPTLDSDQCRDEYINTDGNVADTEQTISKSRRSSYNSVSPSSSRRSSVTSIPSLSDRYSTESIPSKVKTLYRRRLSLSSDGPDAAARLMFLRRERTKLIAGLTVKRDSEDTSATKFLQLPTVNKERRASLPYVGLRHENTIVTTLPSPRDLLSSSEDSVHSLNHLAIREMSKSTGDVHNKCDVDNTALSDMRRERRTDNAVIVGAVGTDSRRQIPTYTRRGSIVFDAHGANSADDLKQFSTKCRHPLAWVQVTSQQQQASSSRSSPRRENTQRGDCLINVQRRRSLVMETPSDISLTLRRKNSDPITGRNYLSDQQGSNYMSINAGETSGHNQAGTVRSRRERRQSDDVTTYTSAITNADTGPRNARTDAEIERDVEFELQTRIRERLLNESRNRSKSHGPIQRSKSQRRVDQLRRALDDLTEKRRTAEVLEMNAATAKIITELFPSLN
ncbi:uncharacterized protein [Ptychodera flava]|uniref:uncharacterized protein n=1 Tax=Ptychodera flava TaxID=63121 RepID=UPI00396A9C0C